MDAYTLFAVGGTGPSDVWAVGRNGMIGHYDGSTWKFGLQATLNNLLGVWAISPEDVWAVGQNGTRIHYANRAWTAIQADLVATVSVGVGRGRERRLDRRRPGDRLALGRDHLDVDGDREQRAAAAQRDSRAREQ